jgi:hypothetical protein
VHPLTLPLLITNRYPRGAKSYPAAFYSYGLEPEKTNFIGGHEKSVHNASKHLGILAVKSEGLKHSQTHASTIDPRALDPSTPLHLMTIQ